jgi:hypothetical protein
MSNALARNRSVAIPLYQRDLYAWSREQARLLKDGRLEEIDAENIAEEILDVGSNEYDKLESALRVLLMHMLKWDYQPERRSSSWAATIVEQRFRVEKQLRKNPSLKSRLPEAVADGYKQGRVAAWGETGMELDLFPEECPYDWDTILTREFKR